MLTQMFGMAYAQQELATLQNQFAKLTQEIAKTPKPKKAVVMSTPAAPAPRVELAAADYIKYLDEAIAAFKDPADPLRAKLMSIKEYMQTTGKTLSDIPVIPEAPALPGMGIPEAPPPPIIEAPTTSGRTVKPQTKKIEAPKANQDLLKAITEGTRLKKVSISQGTKTPGVKTQNDELLQAIRARPPLKKAATQVKPVAPKDITLSSELEKRLARRRQQVAPEKETEETWETN